jgi:hypothetical protein
MTPVESDILKSVLELCERYHKNKKDWHIYEQFKRMVLKINLPSDEYEAALTKIAGIIGV